MRVDPDDLVTERARDLHGDERPCHARVRRVMPVAVSSSAFAAVPPSATIPRFRTNAPSHNPTFLAKRERVYEGMRMAGVPEE